MLFLVSSLSASKRTVDSDSIMEAMGTEGGIMVARDESLPRVVAEAKLAKAIDAAGKIFHERIEQVHEGVI